MSKHTPGPWEVWSGPDYAGGGADLCIGAGETWLANMNHRLCVNHAAHVCYPCRLETDTRIASLEGCQCPEECPEANHITEEQMANARLIAAAPELLEALIQLSNEVARTVGLIEPQMRAAAGNTNVAVLLEKLTQARAAIAKAEGR